MTHHIACLSSTRFQLAHGVSAAQISELIAKHMPDCAATMSIVASVPDFEKNLERYTLRMEAAEIPSNAGFDVFSLVKEMGPLVANPFSVRVRDDSMNDERDEVFYGGPTAESIAEFEGKEQIQDALECLGHSPIAIEARAALQHIARWIDSPARHKSFDQMSQREQLEKARSDALQALATGDWGEGKPFEKEADARSSYDMAVEALAELPLPPRGSDLTRILTGPVGPQVTPRQAIEAYQRAGAGYQRNPAEKPEAGSPKIAILVDGGVVIQVVTGLPGVDVRVVDFDSEDCELSSPRCRLVDNVQGGPILAVLGSPEVMVDAGRMQALFAAEQRRFAFAKKDEDWLSVASAGSIDLVWLEQEGVILDVTDPKHPQLALNEMQYLVQDMGVGMNEQLAAVLEHMDMAFAKGEDAQPGFDEKRRKLADLLDASPWQRDMDGGGGWVWRDPTARSRSRGALDQYQRERG